MARKFQIASTMVFALCSVSVLSSFHSNDAHANSGIFSYGEYGEFNKWAGKWGCSFEVGETESGPLTAITQLTIYRNGNLDANSTSATNNPAPFNIFECTATGAIENVKDDYMRYDIKGQCRGTDDVAFDFEQQADCLGVMNLGRGYTELNCIDTTDEPDEENRDQVWLATCKKVNPRQWRLR